MNGFFRSNSSILGQRKKNQRKSRNKAKKHQQNATTKSGTSPVSSSSVDESDHADTADGEMESKLSGALEGVNLCDSGVEIDDSDPGTISNPTSTNPVTKKNKKKNRVKTNRRRAISESSSGEMIFDLDL